MKVLWLRPSTGDNVSVRRTLISEHLGDMGIDVTLVDATGFNALSAAWKAITGNHDIIVGNVRMGLYLGYPLSVVLRKPFVGDVTDPLSQIEDLPRFVFKMLEWYEWFVLRKADESVFVYQASHEEALVRGIIGPIRLPNAVNYERFADPDGDVIDQTDRILRANEINPNAQIAIYTGSMVDRYHLAEVGKAAEQLQDWEFVFVGKERGADIHSIVAGKSNAHFIGSYDYELIPGFLSHSNLGLCLIDAEQPLKLKEFTASGLPTLVIPKMKQWYDYDNLIYTDVTPDAIVDAISGLDRSAISDREVEKYEREIESWREISQQYYQLFDQLHAENH